MHQVGQAIAAFTGRPEPSAKRTRTMVGCMLLAPGHSALGPQAARKVGVKLYGRVRNYFAVLTPPFTSEYETITVFDVPSVMFPIETVFSMVNMPL